MFLLYLFGMIFFIILIEIVVGGTILIIGDGKKQWISLAIIGISLITSIYYFHYMNEEFTTNFIKHPEKILPTLLLIICIVSILTFVFFVMRKTNSDFLNVFGVAIILIFLVSVIYPRLIPQDLIYTIINEEISSKKEFDKYSQYKIIEKEKHNKNHFIKMLTKEELCDYFVLNLDSKIKENHYFENKVGKMYFIDKEFYLNNKKYNENNQECKKGDNIISFKMIEK